MISLNTAAKERLVSLTLTAFAFSSLVFLFLIFLFILIEGLPLFFKVGVKHIILGFKWAPTRGSFGIFPMIVSSCLVTVGALLIGAAAGLMSGLMGVGGGIVMIPLMTAFLGLTQHKAHGTSLAVIVFTAIAGALTYGFTGHTDLLIALELIAGSMIVARKSQPLVKVGRSLLGRVIDATGDADVVARMGLPVYQRDQVQPPTMCVILRGLDAIRKKHPKFNLHSVIFDAQYPQALKPGFAWGRSVPGGNDEYMLAGTRVYNANCSEADELTAATIEGRRQVRAVCDILRENFMDGQGTPLLTLPAKLGLRESRHARCLHTLTQDELLSGHRFPDAIGNGTYPVDIHNARGGGITFRHLEKAPFYQMPYSSLVPQGAHNVLVAGRSIDADEGAFGAVRVMINCNQTGQAAGVAAWLALDSGQSVAEIDTARLRETLKKQGAAIF